MRKSKVPKVLKVLHDLKNYRQGRGDDVWWVEVSLEAIVTMCPLYEYTK